MKVFFYILLGDNKDGLVVSESNSYLFIDKPGSQPFSI